MCTMHFSKRQRSLTFENHKSANNIQRSIQLLAPIEVETTPTELKLDVAIAAGRKFSRVHSKTFIKDTPTNEVLLACASEENQTQVSKKGPEVIAVGRADGIIITPNKDPVLRVSQLEQNIRFLQEQHQSMLSGLHSEIEILRQRNRDLQFQLVFAKGGVVLSTPSSPEDDSKPRILLSPKQVNVTPLQIELLEKELGELKINLQEANTKNSYLSAIVDEQKKKLETFESEWQQMKVVTPSQQELELRQKLEDSDRLIRRLRRDNEEQRRELATLRSTFQNGETYAAAPQSRDNYSHGRHNGGGGGGGGGAGRRGSHHRGQREHRFPPLHTQSYWHQSNGRGGRGQPRSDRGENEGSGGGTTLPSLRAGDASDSMAGYSTFPNHQGNGNRRSGGYQGNGNHQYRDGDRKYRGQNRGTKS